MVSQQIDSGCPPNTDQGPCTAMSEKVNKTCLFISITNLPIKLSKIHRLCQTVITMRQALEPQLATFWLQLNQFCKVLILQGQPVVDNHQLA